MQKLRPRELSRKFGYQSLSTAELLALVLRFGTRTNSVYSVSESIATIFDNCLIAGRQVEEFLSQTAIQVPAQSIKATVLGAVFEIARRNHQQQLPTLLAKPSEIVKRFSSLVNKKQELVYGIYVDSRLRVVSEQLLAKGTTDAVYIEARDILYYAIKYRTRRFMLVHNHPSGDPTPSRADIDLTKNVSEAAAFFQAELLDHVIIAKQGYYSFREQNVVL
jgi:DNA repair protein RadC